MDNKSKIIENLVRYNKKVQNLAFPKSPNVSDEQWEIAYRKVFSKTLSYRIFYIMRDLNECLDYYDPDTSYEEDVKAYANALNDKVKSLQKIYGGLK